MEEKKKDKIQKIAIQDTYGERFQHCWGCGKKNSLGLNIKSYPNEKGDKCILFYKPDEQFTGGVPLHLFGGMTAMIFDCHGAASAAFFNHKRKGLELKEDTVISRFITARLEVDFKKPIPIGEEIKVTSTVEEIKERKVVVLMEMEVLGEVRAKARMVAVLAKDNM